MTAVGILARRVQKDMGFHCGLVLSKLRPGKERETQIDYGGIQSIGSLIELNGERIAQVKFSGASDQHLGKVLVDAPIAYRVGVSQGVAGDRATNSHVVELSSRRAQTGLDVSQTFAIGELSKGH